MKARRRKRIAEGINLRSVFYTLLAIFVVSSYFYFHYSGRIRIALVTDPGSRDQSQETRILLRMLGKYKNYSVRQVDIHNLNSEPRLIRSTDIVWIHITDTAFDQEPFLVAAQKAYLDRYVERGGSMFLSMEAARLVYILGLEPSPPASRSVVMEDQGYGRKAGLHSFRGHPLFKELNGGAFLFCPKNDVMHRMTGYFEGELPRNGKVVAVDWSYIHLREENKLVMEYDKGKGKVITVGAYMIFSEPNLNALHLEKFTTNTLDYLAGKQAGERARHWDYEKKRPVPFNSDSRPIPFGSVTPWAIPDDSTMISVRSAGDDPWDVAGKQIVILGNETGGIEEIWSLPFMAMRDYAAGILFDGDTSIHWLSNAEPDVKVRPGMLEREYKFSRAYLREIIVAHPEKPLAQAHYEYRGASPARLYIQFHSNLRMMWPYPVSACGNIHYGFDRGMNAFLVRDESNECAVVVGTNASAENAIIGPHATIVPGDTVQPVVADDFMVTGIFEIVLETNHDLDVFISASSVGIGSAISGFRSIAQDPGSILSDLDKYSGAMAYTEVITPDPVFNKAYRWAVIGTDKLFATTPGLASSMVAGYGTTAKGWDGGQEISGRPGYAWYFGRDAAWSGMAVLDYGDFNSVKNILVTFQDYQDLNGKIFHEMTASGVVHYDAADANPLYVILAGRYLRHSGDVAFIRKSWKNIKKALDYSSATDTDGDLLIENPGVGHGWVEGGGLYGARTTLYLASLWAEALKEASYIASVLKLDLEQEFRKKYHEVISALEDQYWNSGGRFYYYGKWPDGTFLPEKTVMAAIPLLFGQASGDRASSVLDHLVSNPFTADWGVRIVPENSPLFNPNGYHTGSVWPLFTGWSSLAGYRYHRSHQGFSHLMNNLLLHQYWSKGYTEEVLHGLVFQPSGVCAHQGWSQSMAVQPVVEGMLGFVPEALEHGVTLGPQIPVDWEKLGVRNLKAGNHSLDMTMTRNRDSITYHFRHRGPVKLNIRFRPVISPATRIKGILINGEPVRPTYLDTVDNKIPDLRFHVRNHAKVEFLIGGETDVIPVCPAPEPGEQSKAFRLISRQWVRNELRLVCEGRRGTTGMLRVLSSRGIPAEVTNAELVAVRSGISEISVPFEASGDHYQRKLIIVRYED